MFILNQMEKEEKDDRFLNHLIWLHMPEKMFGMYGGKEEWVRIECDNSFAGVMIDRFGKRGIYDQIG